jgi:hypothetical protein
MALTQPALSLRLSACAVGPVEPGVSVQVGGDLRIVLKGPMGRHRHVDRRIAAVVALVVSIGGTAGCAGSNKSAQRAVRVAAAGDIACDPSSRNFDGHDQSGCQQRRTADVIESLDPDAVLALGDTQYECGQARAYAQSYGPSWGRFVAKTHPVVGNHEYYGVCTRQNNRAYGYFGYFGSAAGAPGRGYYSVDLGSWHLLALNSECDHVPNGCGTNSSEYAFVLHDIRTHPGTCTLVMWHEPRFSSGAHGDAEQMGAIWNALVGHASIALAGHAHDYERFDPIGVTPVQTSNGQPQNELPVYQEPVLDANGIRQFVVGTGGEDHQSFTTSAGAPIPPLRGEVVRNDDTFGVLSLELSPGSYRWRFVPVRGGAFTDSGQGTCRRP